MSQRHTRIKFLQYDYISFLHFGEKGRNVIHFTNSLVKLSIVSTQFSPSHILSMENLKQT